MNTLQAEKFFGSVKPSTVARYADYWESVKPKTQDDIFRRYLFAFASVHTTWEGNLRGYKAIKNLDWLCDKETLRNKLIQSRCGMHNQKTEHIWDFRNKFLNDPNFFCIVPENWKEYRNKLSKFIIGIGLAKVSFTLEMCFPNEAEVTCIDTHGIQLYELPTDKFQSKKQVEIYEKAENHWLDGSKSVSAPSYIARCIFWDRKQKRKNSRYWSYVLES